MNKNETARHLNVSVPTLNHYITKGLPYEIKGNRTTDWKFSKKAVNDWMKSNGKTNAKQNAEDYALARTKKMEAEAAIATMNKQKMEGELVPIDNVSDVVASEYAIVRSHLRGLCNVVAPLLVNKNEEEISQIIATKVDQILSELSDPDRILEDKATEEQETVPKASD